MILFLAKTIMWFFFSGQEDYEIITYGSLSENLKAHDLTWFMGAAKSNKYPIFPG